IKSLRFTCFFSIGDLKRDDLPPVSTETSPRRFLHYVQICAIIRNYEHPGKITTKVTKDTKDM
ncbi:MAG: hypothetical protein WBD36_15760, partial [Bacteroidota bacterium]